MFLRAALSVIPRPRPSALPSTVVTFTSTASVADVAKYASVCGYALSDVLPPLYPHVMAFSRTTKLMSGNDFPFPVVGLVHIGNRLVSAAPMPLSAELFFTVRAVDLRPHRRGQQFDVVTTASLASDGPTVWSETSTYLRRRPATSASVAAPETDQSLVDGPAAAVWNVAPSVGRAYASVSGDYNPIHTSTLGARTFGFKKPIAHGMWTKARLLASIRLDPSFTIDVRFRAPIFLGSRVSLHTSGSSADVRGRNDRLHLTAALT
jgi:acyl dehydratase